MRAPVGDLPAVPANQGTHARTALDQAIREALDMSDGYLLPWRVFGCQVANPHRARLLLTCPYREAIHQCEVIGPHTRHRWSDHLVCHERAGNGWSCRSIGDGRVTVKMGDPVTGRTYTWWAAR
jgi:hypothetical protein